MNPNIALQVQRPRFNALAARQAANQYHAGQQQQQLNALKLAEAADTYNRNNRVRNSLKGLDQADPNYFRNVANVYAGAGDPSTATSILKNLSELDAANLTKLKEQAALSREAFGLMQHEGSYAQGLELLDQIRPGASAQFGPTWSPEIGAQAGKMALSANEVATLNQNAIGKTKPYPPAVAQQKQDIARAGKSSVVYSTEQEKEEDKAYGKTLVGRYEKIVETADNALAELQNLEMLKNIDVETGGVEPLKAWVGNLALSLGVPEGALERIGIDQITEAESFIGVAQNLVLTKMQAQKGPQTEGDAKRIQSTVASLGNTPGAKDFLLEAAIALRHREIEQAEFYDRWKADKGTFDGARQAWNHWRSKTPLMGTQPESGLPYFFHQFMDAARKLNPGAAEKDLLAMWRKKYGKNN